MLSVLIAIELEHTVKNNSIGESYKGSTKVFGILNSGSIPFSPAKKTMLKCFYEYTYKQKTQRKFIAG